MVAWFGRERREAHNNAKPVIHAVFTHQRCCPPCRCGGEDGSTQWICAQQAITTWEIFIFPSNATFNWTAGKGGCRV